MPGHPSARRPSMRTTRFATPIFIALCSIAAFGCSAKDGVDIGDVPGVGDTMLAKNSTANGRSTASGASDPNPANGSPDAGNNPPLATGPSGALLLCQGKPCQCNN